MKRTARISECGTYRYQLSRIWDDSKPKVMFLMLNPSTADANQDDNTIKRCIAFAKSWGKGGFYVGNLFAYRSTDPKALIGLASHIAVGGENLLNLAEMSGKSQYVVCAWGLPHIVKKVMKPIRDEYHPLNVIRNPMYLALCKDLTPRHPLMLKSELIPKPFIGKL